MKAQISRRHGDPLTYRGNGGRRGCRCDQCREAHRVHTAAARAENAARGLAPGHPAHGTRNGCSDLWCPAGGRVMTSEVTQ